jgi:large-conductance mechanosensitive channel
MNRCVGKKNYGYFILFVITLLIVHIVVLVSDFIMLKEIKSLHDKEDTSVELKNDFDESHTVSFSLFYSILTMFSFAKR